MAKRPRPLSLKRTTVRRLAPTQLAGAAGAEGRTIELTIVATGACDRTQGLDCGCGGGNDSKGIGDLPQSGATYCCGCTGGDDSTKQTL